MIRQLIIEDGLVYIGALGIGQQVALPRIEMNNIGEGGNNIADVLDTVLSKVLTSIGPAIADAGKLLRSAGGDALKAVQEDGLNKIDEAKNEAINKASEGIKNLFGQ